MESCGDRNPLSLSPSLPAFRGLALLCHRGRHDLGSVPYVETCASAAGSGPHAVLLVNMIDTTMLAVGHGQWPNNRSTGPCHHEPGLQICFPLQHATGLG